MLDFSFLFFFSLWGGMGGVPLSVIYLHDYVCDLALKFYFTGCAAKRQNTMHTFSRDNNKKNCNLMSYLLFLFFVCFYTMYVPARTTYTPTHNYTHTHTYNYTHKYTHVHTDKKNYTCTKTQLPPPPPHTHT